MLRSLSILGFHLVYFPFSVFFVAACFFFFHFPLTAWVWLPALILQVPFVTYQLKGARAILTHLFAFTGIVLIAVLYSGAFYDFSWDGIYYHQVGILRLVQGWNPFHRYANPQEVFGDQWWLLTNMTKLTWFYQAAWLAVTGQIELSKHIGFLFLMASFLVVWSTLADLARLSLKSAAFLALVITLNPIVTSQILTFYVDGCLASVLTLFIACCFRYFYQPGRWALAMVMMVFVVAMNIKLTGAVYAGVIGLGFLIWMMIRRNWKTARLWAIAGVVSLLIGAGLGFSPFITNLIGHGNPMRPLEEATVQPTYDPYQLQRPRNMEPISRVGRFAASIFSKSNASGPPLKFNLKWPFAVSADEFESMRVLDCRVGGFGPWFGGALLLSLILLLARIWKKDPEGPLLLIMLCWVLASVLINPEAWWARFVPQAWLLPLIPLWMGSTQKSVALKKLRAVTLATIAINAIGVGVLSISYQFENARQVEYSMDRLLMLPGPLGIDFGPWEAARYRFEMRGIPFVDLTHRLVKTCQPVVRIGAAELKICPSGLY